MKIKKLLLVLLAVLLVFSLFGCGKKEPVEDVEPQDTTEQEELTPVVTEEEKPQEEVLLTTAELHALFKKEYDTERFAKSNLYADQYKDFYMKLPAREIGTQVDANVYSYIESTVKGAGYEGKILPDDGFEQYVAWREALEKGSSSGNNQSGNNSGNTGNTSNETQKPPTKPSGGSNNSSRGSSNNSGSSGGSQGGTGQNGDPTANIRNGSGATDVPEGGFDEKEYEKPSYEIIG